MLQAKGENMKMAKMLAAMLLLPTLAMAQTPNIDPSLRRVHKQTIGMSGAAAFETFPVSGTTMYMVTNSSTVEQEIAHISAVSGTFKNLFVTEFGLAPSGASITYTWRINGVSTGITCTIVSPAVSCSDLTHSVAIVAGQSYDLQTVVASPSAFGDSVSAGIELDTP
jgi:hypothetical protein